MALIGEAKKYVPLADSLGYNHSYNARTGYIFEKGIVRIWQMREGWQVADLIDGHYSNHRPYLFLEDALKMEA